MIDRNTQLADRAWQIVVHVRDESALYAIGCIAIHCARLTARVAMSSTICFFDRASARSTRLRSRVEHCRSLPTDASSIENGVIASLDVQAIGAVDKEC
jgi:hypothetical protein